MTWWEVFHFVIEEAAPEVIDATVDAVIAAFIVWARGRFRKDGHGRAERAPKHATIYGPDGKTVLKEVSVKRDEEPEITTPEA